MNLKLQKIISAVKPKPYEWVLIFSICAYGYLMRRTNIFFSSDLIWVFVSYIGILLFVTYLTAFCVVSMKVYADWKISRDKKVIFSRAILKFAQPYYTPQFFFRCLRRGISLFGVIYLFLHLKHVVLAVHYANFDRYFWDLDRWLHFGIQPNIFLMQEFGLNNEIAVFLDWFYLKYFFFKIVIFVFFMLELRTVKLSDKFFTAITLIWSLGGLAYLVAPTDGPCYAILYEQSVRREDRVHLFNYPVTREVPRSYIKSYKQSKIWLAKGYQEKLWNVRANFLYKNKEPAMFYGIAAMPSLHVAVMVVMTFFLFLVSRYLGLIACGFTAVIFVGSIFLQWHYAVDGYVGALLAVVVSVIACSVGGRERGNFINQEPHELHELFSV